MNRALNLSAVLSMIICTTELKEPREYLLLDLICFVNHDCKVNAEFVIQKDNVTARALQGIEKGEEVTVKYVKDYFGPDSSSCLCRSCEIQSLGGWAGEPAGSGNQPTAQWRRAPDSMLYPRWTIKMLMRSSATNYKISKQRVRETASACNSISAGLHVGGLATFCECTVVHMQAL